MPEACKVFFSGATLSEWREGYLSGSIRPDDLLDIVNTGSGDSAWITTLNRFFLYGQLK